MAVIFLPSVTDSIREVFSRFPYLSDRYLATGISLAGSSVRDTLTVSPIPSDSSADMPAADFILPESPFPASVTPRWRGKAIPFSSMASAKRRYASTITIVLLAFRETTAFVKSFLTHRSSHSIAASFMASGVFPYKVVILSPSEP